MLRSLARARPSLPLRSRSSITFPLLAQRTYAYPPGGVFQEPPDAADPRRPSHIPPPAADNQPVHYPIRAPSVRSPYEPFSAPPPPSGPPPPNSNPPRRSLLFRAAKYTTLALISAYAFALTYDLFITRCLQLASVPYPPGSPDDLEQLRELQEEFDDLPLVRILRSYFIAQDGELARRWSEWDAYQGVHHSVREERLTTGPLQGSAGVGAQKIFRDELTGTVLCFVNFGEGTTGWPGVVHGGLISTLFDEVLARCGLRLTEQRTGVTAYLKVTFADKAETGQWYVLMASPMPDAGNTDRKKFVQGAMFCTGMDHELEPDPSVTNAIPHLAKIAGARSGLPPPLGISGHVQSKKKETDMKTKGMREDQGEASAFHGHAFAEALYVVPKGIELKPIREDF